MRTVHNLTEEILSSWDIHLIDLSGSAQDNSSLIHTLIARFMGPHGAHLGPTGPRWAPYWPHELCYLGTLKMQPHPQRPMIQIFSRALAELSIVWNKTPQVT